VGIQAAGERVALRVTDDGVGFDPASAPEGSGLATMRAAVAVTGGTLVVGSRPGEGTTILAHLGPDRSPAPAPPAPPPSPPSLRIVPSG
jgi:signal transduction histidine kinase